MVTSRSKTFRLSDGNADKFELDSKLHGVSEAEYFRKLLEQGITRKPKGIQELMLDCSATCYHCKQKLEPGDTVFYSGKIGIICKNCIDPSKSSKTLVKKDLRILERKRTSKAYDIEITDKRQVYLEIVTKLEDLSFAEDLEQMKGLLVKFDDYLERFLKMHDDPYDMKKYVENWVSCFKELQVLKGQQQARLLKHIKLADDPKKKKKKQEAYVT